MIDFSTLQSLTIPEGVVTKIECGGVVLWQAAKATSATSATQEGSVLYIQNATATQTGTTLEVT